MQRTLVLLPFAGETEMQEGKITLKNMTTGEQELVKPEEIISRF